MLESQADNNARAYFLPEDITSSWVITNIQRSKKSKLAIKHAMILGQLVKSGKYGYNSTRLRIIPMVDNTIPYGFNPSKLYANPKLIFSSAIRGNLELSRVWDINQVTAEHT